MSTFQIALSICALILLTALMLTVNRTSVDRGSDMIMSEVSISALSIAQATLAEIDTKAFDQANIESDGSRIQVEDVNELTQFTHFGPDTGENTRHDFNDVDDYYGYTETIHTNYHTGFELSVDVTYADNLGNPTTARTHYKLVEVRVWHPNMENNIGPQSMEGVLLRKLISNNAIRNQ